MKVCFSNTKKTEFQNRTDLTTLISQIKLSQNSQEVKQEIRANS